MREPSYLLPTEIETGLDFCARHEFEETWKDACRLFRITITTGLRTSDIARLKLPVDIQDDKFIVRRAKTNHLVPIPHELVPYLRVWLQEHTLKTGYLFRNKQGSPVSRFHLIRVWKKFLDHAKIRQVPIEEVRKPKSVLYGKF